MLKWQTHRSKVPSLDMKAKLCMPRSYIFIYIIIYFIYLALHTLTLVCIFPPNCSQYISLGTNKDNFFNTQELLWLHGDHFLYFCDLTAYFKGDDTTGDIRC